MTDQPLLIALHDIKKSYPGVQALGGVDFTVRNGEVHGLAGENGAGKSTLMKVIAGVVAPDAGTVAWRGETVRWRGPGDALAAGIRLIHQELYLVPALSVAENICLGNEPSRFGIVRRRALHDEAARVLATLGVNLDPGTLVGKLSVGQQQMVEIAKALGANAQLIAMDEPTSALTDAETSHLFELIARLKERGVGIIYVSHRLEEMARLCDRVTVLRDGRTVATRPMREMTIDELILLMVGRAPLEMPRSTSAPGEVALQVERLWRRGAFGEISLEVRRGEILGLAGLMGAGRTSLLRALFGADPVDGGRVLVDGVALPLRCPAEAIARGLALVPEDRKGEGLLLDRSLRENVSLASLDELATAGFINRGAERAAAERAIGDLGIRTPSAEQPVKQLSGGNQQKVVLGKWLRRRPRVLLLDEPTRGIDIGAKSEIHRLVRRLADEGMAIVLASSELPEVLALADRIAVLHEGRLTGIVPRETASEASLMRLMTGQVAA